MFFKMLKIFLFFFIFLSGFSFNPDIKIGYRSNSKEQKEVASVICKFIEKTSKSSCDVYGFSSSEEIYGALMRKKIDFAMLRGNVEARYSQSLYSVMSLYKESLTVLSKNGNIETMSELIGNNIDIAILEGVNGMLTDSIAAEGYISGDYSKDKNIKQFQTLDDLISALKSGKFYAAILSTYHPNQKIAELIADGYKISNVDGNGVNKMINDKLCYFEGYVPENMYKDQVTVNTVAVVVGLVSSKMVDVEKVKTLTRAVFMNFERFKLSHNALLELTPKEMITDSISDLHPSTMEILTAGSGN